MGDDVSDSGHPRNFGYWLCKTCGHERPKQSIGGLGSCNDWSWCIDQQKPALVRELVAAAKREAAQGWDANGAPTGIDANGDAA